MHIHSEKNTSQTQRLLEYDISEGNPDIVEQKLPTIQRTIVSAALCLICFASSVFSLILYNKKYNLAVYSDKLCFYITTIALYSSIFLCIWTFVDIILIFIAYKFNDRESRISFISTAVIYNCLYIKTSTSLILFCLITKLILKIRYDEYDPNIKRPSGANSTNYDQDEKIFEHTIFETGEEEVVQKLLSISLFMAIILIERLILQYINYSIHYKYYYERIKENNKQIKYILALNKKMQINVNFKVETWARKVFVSLTGDTNYLCVDNFISLFKEEGYDMFTIFDINNDNWVSEEEFVKCYISIFKEKKRLKCSLSENDTSMRKLAIVLTILFLPLAIFAALAVLGWGNIFQNATTSILGLVLPAAFIFGPVLSEMFQSIIFIFSVRPFDIGDIISVESKCYEVLEMGLLYTTLLYDTKFHNFPNEMLRKRPIINLRKSKYVTETITQKYFYDSIKLVIDDFKKCVQQFLLDNKKMFRKEFNISSLELVEGSALLLCIEIRLNCMHQDFQAIRERKDYFVLFLHETVVKMGIKYA